MASVRAQVTFEAPSGLPEDRMINVLHFNLGASDYAAHVAAIDAALTQFWGEEFVGLSVGELLSPYVQRAFTIRYYDLTQGEPRTPTVMNHALAAAITDVGLPEEVAIVASFHGEPPVTARRRGRIYIGPLVNNSAVISMASATDGTNVALGARSTIIAACEVLATSGVGWCVRSITPSENFVPIVGGWVDDALDTQRRRGPDASLRSVWP